MSMTLAMNKDYYTFCKVLSLIARSYRLAYLTKIMDIKHGNYNLQNNNKNASTLISGRFSPEEW